MKKFISVILSCVFVLCTVFPFEKASAVTTRNADITDTQSEKNENLAYISFKSGELKTKNIDEEGLKANNEIKSKMSERDNTGCIVIDDSLYFALDKSFANGNTDGDAYTVEIDYYDEGEGFFRVYYDCMDYGDGIQKQQRYGNYVDDTTYLKNTNTWKTATIDIDNAYFGKRIYDLGKYDIMFTAKDWASEGYLSCGNIPVREIRVIKHPKKNPIHILSETDVTGHIFDWYKDEKIITNTFTNQTDSTVTCEVTYEIKSNENLKTYFEKTETIVFEPRQALSVPLNFGKLERCGIFDLEISVKCESAGIDQRTKPLAFSVVKSDPDGICNDFMYIAAGLDRYMWVGLDDYVDQICELVKKAGFKGVRSETDVWSSYEKEKGVYKLSNYSTTSMEKMKKYDLEWIHLLVWNNPLYLEDATNGTATLPQGEKELAAWSEFVKHFINDTKGTGAIYELWNEPADSHFDWRSNREPEVYAKLAETTVKAARETGENVLITGPAPADIWNEDNWHYGHLYGTLKAGAAKALDAISVHPYALVHPESLLTDEDNGFTRIKKAVAEYGGSENADIYITEAGVSYGNTNFYGKTSKDVGAFNIRFANLLVQKDLAKNYCPYSITRTGTLENQREDTFGFIRYGLNNFSYYGKPFTAKEQYLMIAAYNYLMAKATPGGIYDPDYNTRVQKFYSDKFKKDIAALNSVEGTEQVTIDLGVNSVEQIDEYGNSTLLHSDDGKYDLVLGEIPFYLMGNFEKFEVQKNNDSKFLYKNLSVSLSQGDTYTIEIDKNIDKDINVEVESGTDFEVIENNGFINNKALVTLKSFGNEDVDSRALIKLVDNDGNIVSIANTKAIVNKSIEIDSAVMSLPYDNKSTFWQCEIKIKNHQISQPLNGYIEFKSPSIFKSLGKIDIGNIPAQKTGIVKFNVPNVLQKGMYTLSYDLVTKDGKQYTFASNVDMTIADYASQKPTIDGKADRGEWKTDTQMVTDDISKVQMLIAGEIWNGPDDLSAKSIIEWDEDNLYLLCKVTDNVFWQPYGETETWKGDGIQLGICYNADKNVTYGEINGKFHEICIAKTNDGPKAYRTLCQNHASNDKGPLQNYELAIGREGNVTTYEFKIAWKDLLEKDETPKEGEYVKYAFLVNDNDNTTEVGYGRRGYIRYADGIGGVKNTNLFTNMKLIKTN